MSIPKLQLVPQPQPLVEIIRHAPDTLDFTRGIIVNRERLAEALRDARYVSGILHNVENLDDLEWEVMSTCAARLIARFNNWQRCLTRRR